MTNGWSGWYSYSEWKPDPDSFRETLDGGQAFCWKEKEAKLYEGVVAHIPFRIRWEPPNQVFWQTLTSLTDEANVFLREYLLDQKTYRAYYDALPWRSDPHLKRCMDRFPELRILGQPYTETLLGFLCSATKQIVQIKEMLALLRDRFGAPVTLDYKSLPTWQNLGHIEEAALRECKFGFRAKNIKKTADLLSQSPNFLAEVRTQDYSIAKASLSTLPGVGEKIADCVLLFGYQKLQAFPVDTWILKAMQRHYGLQGWTPQQISHFGRTHFGAYAGLAQQFLFAWERRA